jgi:GxxExxY protein
MAADKYERGELAHPRVSAKRELSEQIIGAAMTVLNTLGPGLSEKIYENALVIELTRMGLRVDQQDEYRVEYRGSEAGRLKPDVLVEKKVYRRYEGC